MIIIHAVNDLQEAISGISLATSIKAGELTRCRLLRPARLGEATSMLRWALIFLVVALIAAVFGFGGIAAGAASIAKLLFVLFLVVFVVSLIMGLVRRA
jgi:uncharacterized membrane protein YtjA (UPF0391 family)